MDYMFSQLLLAWLRSQTLILQINSQTVLQTWEKFRDDILKLYLVAEEMFLKAPCLSENY